MTMFYFSRIITRTHGIIASKWKWNIRFITDLQKQITSYLLNENYKHVAKGEKLMKTTTIISLVLGIVEFYTVLIDILYVKV